jgi:Asp-tRNA(Asn)/Glu-tRNA(Gln) amidotransferase B subunit
MPELPARWPRASCDYGLPEYDAAMMTQSLAMARYFRGGARRLRPAQAGQPTG